MTPKIKQRLEEFRDGKAGFDGEIFLLHDFGDRCVVLAVPAEYRFEEEQFEHAAGDAMRDSAADWGPVRHPILMLMRDEDQREIPTMLRVVGGEDD